MNECKRFTFFALIRGPAFAPVASFAVNSPIRFQEAMPKKFKGTPAQERALSTYVKLERAASAAFAMLVRAEEEGLTLSQFAVLEALFTWAAVPGRSGAAHPDQ